MKIGIITDTNLKIIVRNYWNNLKRYIKVHS